MLFWTLLVLQVPFTLAGISTVWERFWSVSCQYSSPVTREKRSNFEEPDLSEPEDIFNYLYPMAHLKAEDFHNESQRSAYPPPSLSTWLSDLIEFWEHECHLRTMEEESEEESEELEEDELEEILEPDDFEEDSPVNPMSLVGNGSAGNLSSSEGGNREGKSSSRVYGTNYPPPGMGNRRGVSRIETGSAHSPGYGFEETSQTKRPRKKLRKRKRQSTTPPPPETMMTKPPEKAATKADPEAFFSSYGGDIEYFFPLISFGIPFDGEITFLGFHGFKGLFPYR